MRKLVALEAISALSQETRLDAFMLLVACEPHGLQATEIADKLRVAKSTMSLHFRILEKAKLIKAERRGRTVTYRADLKTYEALMVFLVKDCCQSVPSLREPLIQKIQDVCDV